MKGLIAVLAIIVFLVSCGSLTSALAQTVTISSPTTGAFFQRIGGTSDLSVFAGASGVPSGGGVEFVLDAGKPAWRSARDPSAPYQNVFTGVLVGEHTLDAYVVSSTGSRLASDHEERIGIGDMIVAMGDSITAGQDDDISTDNWSADGRIGPWIDPADGHQYGGYEPILSNLLTAQRGYPVIVLNQGWPGDTTYDAIADAYTFARQYPSAGTWILAYGTNDSNQGISVATYKSNLQTTINRIREVIPGAVFYLPKVLYWTHPAIQDYHDKLGDIARNVPGVHWGADLDTLFRANHQLYTHNPAQPGTWFSTTNTHHPNGIGVQKMAMLWQLALTDQAILVTDGVLSGAGSTWADKIHVEGANLIGLSQSNLLEICEQSPAGAPPPGTSYLSFWGFSLKLTGSSGFRGGPLTTSVRVEDDNLSPVGATSWNQVWLAHNSTLLATTRAVHPRNVHNYNLTADVWGPGQIACVVDVTPPVTTCTVSPSSSDGGGGWYSTVPQITLSAADGTGLPVAALTCHWDANPDAPYSGTLTAPMGEHTLHYHAVDQSGNAEPEKSLAIRASDTPPTPVVSDNARYVIKSDPVYVTWQIASGAPVAEYKYAVGSHAGGTDLRSWTSAGTATGVSWSDPGVSAGTTVYFSVKAFSPGGDSSPAGCSDGVTVAMAAASIGAAKIMADGVAVSLQHVIVNACLGDMAYIEQGDRSAGMGICDAGMTSGRMLTVVGRLTTVKGQRALIDIEPRSSASCLIPRAISIVSRSLHLDSEPGSVARGLSTHGLLVSIYGKVTASGGSGFRVRDGSLNKQRSIYIDASQLSSIPSVGSLVSVTGICGAVTESSVWTPCLEPRSDSDLTVIRR